MPKTYKTRFSQIFHDIAHWHFLLELVNGWKFQPAQSNMKTEKHSFKFRRIVKPDKKNLDGYWVAGAIVPVLEEYGYFFFSD